MRMLFGTHVVDLRAFIAPWLCAKFLRTCKVAAVKYVRDKPAEAAQIDSCFTANHFMAAKAVAKSPSGPPPCVPFTDAARAALWAGWMLVEVDATGDCGIDSMAYYLGADRTEESWLRIRSTIGTFMERIAGDTDWHMIWKNCAENDDAGHALGASFGLGSPVAPRHLPPSASFPPLPPPASPPPLPAPSPPPPLPAPSPPQQVGSFPSALAALSIPTADIDAESWLVPAASVVIDGLVPAHGDVEAMVRPRPKRRRRQ